MRRVWSLLNKSSGVCSSVLYAMAVTIESSSTMRKWTLDVKVWTPQLIGDDVVAALYDWQAFGNEFGVMFAPFHQQHQKLGLLWDVLHELDAWSKDHLLQPVRESLDAFRRDATYDFAAPKVAICIAEHKRLAEALERMMNAAIVHVVYAMGSEYVK